MIIDQDWTRVREPHAADQLKLVHEYDDCGTRERLLFDRDLRILYVCRTRDGQDFWFLLR